VHLKLKKFTKLYTILLAVLSTCLLFTIAGMNIKKKLSVICIISATIEIRRWGRELEIRPLSNSGLSEISGKLLYIGLKGLQEKSTRWFCCFFVFWKELALQENYLHLQSAGQLLYLYNLFTFRKHKISSNAVIAAVRLRLNKVPLDKKFSNKSSYESMSKVVYHVIDSFIWNFKKENSR